jgi:hypothetical protein
MAAAALVVLALALRGPAASACSNDYECSLNGVCKAGACACDVPWTGAACAMIGFDPAPAGGMYGFGVPFATSSWGGNALEDGGLWHLFVTEIAGTGCGLHAWGHSSTVVHATSKTPEGPYTKQGLALPHQAHNPQTIKIGQHWYIFHIGTAANAGEPAPCNEQSGPDNTAFQHPAAAATGSVCHRASSPYGPWAPVVGVPTMNNPSPFLHPNGTLFLVGSRPFAMRASFSGNPGGPWSAPIAMDPDSVGSIFGGKWEECAIPCSESARLLHALAGSSDHARSSDCVFCSAARSCPSTRAATFTFSRTSGATRSPSRITLSPGTASARTATTGRGPAPSRTFSARMCCMRHPSGSMW